MRLIKLLKRISNQVQYCQSFERKKLRILNLLLKIHVKGNKNNF